MFNSVRINGQKFTGVDLDNLSATNEKAFSGYMQIPGGKGKSIQTLLIQGQKDLTDYNKAIGEVVDHTTKKVQLYIGRTYGKYTAKPYSGPISVSRSVKKVNEMHIFLHSEYFKSKTERMDKMLKDPNTFAESPFQDELKALKEAHSVFKTIAYCLNKNMPEKSKERIGIILLGLKSKIKGYERFFNSQPQKN